MTNATTLDGAPILRKFKDGTPIGDGTVFIPLPRNMWQVSMDGKCLCPTCSENPGCTSYWDTLAVPGPGAKNQNTWTVHMPEANPDRLRPGEKSVPLAPRRDYEKGEMQSAPPAEIHGFAWQWRQKNDSAIDADRLTQFGKALLDARYFNV